MAPRRTVLVADDDENDIRLLKRAFLRVGIDVPLIVVRDGEQAIQYLDGEKGYADRDEFPLPALMLLDLKMPRADGFEVLEWVRKQSGLKRLLIVVMTSSDEPRDIDRAYDLGANSYLKKPDDFSNLLKISQKLQEYWIETNLCPTCISRPNRG